MDIRGNKMENNHKGRYEKALDNLVQAEQEYTQTLLKLYPAGSNWLCNHGTHGEYEVKIKSFNFNRGGFIVENTNTHKTKVVPWFSLNEING